MEIKEISKILFSVASSDDIRKKSVYEANVAKYTDSKTNTVYDHRSGAIFNKKCETCNQYEQLCPGHFGHIELNVTIINPILFPHVFNVLKVICYKCSKLIITEDHLKFNDILKFRGEKRLSEIINKIKKFNKCFYCSSMKREYKLNKINEFCNSIYFEDDNNHKIELSDLEIKNIFDDIDDTTVKLLDMSHPKNCFLEVFPVIPPCCRPYEFVGNNFKEDDLTRQLFDIIKINNSIPNLIGKEKTQAVLNLKLKIETFCRNPKNKIKNNNSDPIKGIRERLTGKDGQLRDNLMGKRTEMSGRTVIGPGPNLKLHEVGIPKIMAETLTFPVDVCEHNIDEIYSMIDNNTVEKVVRGGKTIRLDIEKYCDIIKFLQIGDLILRNKKKHIITNTKFDLQLNDQIFRNGVNITPTNIPLPKKFKLKVGDIAQRKLRNGDWVLMNRQPTLWKGSMMAFQVVITNCKTFTFNLAVCKAFNSDFDGDEQNAHIPQSIEASIELCLLSTPENFILNSSNGIPMIVVLQDSLLGAYKMSKPDAMIVSKGVYNDIIMSLSKPTYIYLEKQKHIISVLKKLNKPINLRTGKNILSLIIPKDFNLITEDLKIINGVLIDGLLTKKYLSSSKTSLIFYLKTEYSNEVCTDFINDIQFMTNKWLLSNSFSINLKDCEQNLKSDDNLILEKLKEANFIKKTIINSNLANAKINLILSNAKDIGINLAQQNKNNNFVETIISGSKGDFFNFGQITGLVGQQSVNGKIIPKNLDNGTRSLIHYKKTNLSLIEEYESQGFISESFSSGLNPKSFFFHSISGRQGVCDTAMTTYQSGYIMRKLIKLLECVVVKNDGVVSDSIGVVYDFAYGGLGLNPESKAYNIGRIIDRLNSEI